MDPNKEETIVEWRQCQDVEPLTLRCKSAGCKKVKDAKSLSSFLDALNLKTGPYKKSTPEASLAAIETFISVEGSSADLQIYKENMEKVLTYKSELKIGVEARSRSNRGDTADEFQLLMDAFKKAEKYFPPPKESDIIAVLEKIFDGRRCPMHSDILANVYCEIAGVSRSDSDAWENCDLLAESIAYRALIPTYGIKIEKLSVIFDYKNYTVVWYGSRPVDYGCTPDQLRSLESYR